MDGVIILNTIKTTTNNGMFILFILLEIILIFTGITLTAAYTGSASIKGAAIIALLTILISCGLFYILSVWPRENIYEVALEDGIAWHEFVDRYEVIEINGGILKVKDRTEK